MDCALQAVSIESAITSRDTREYFIPSVPIEMPSLTVIVPNDLRHGARRPSAASAAPRETRPVRALHGSDRAVARWRCRRSGLSKSRVAEARPPAAWPGWGALNSTG